ncbi:putative membrane domain protein [Burkholderia pseudomallei MSHR3960]|nr:putative membrane domain protein [Burkholderia pseudomallei MSHR3960]
MASNPASSDARRGALEMVVAMLMSGTIGWLVVSSRQHLMNVVFSAACSAARRC